MAGKMPQERWFAKKVEEEEPIIHSDWNPMKPAVGLRNLLEGKFRRNAFDLPLENQQKAIIPPPIQAGSEHEFVPSSENSSAPAKQHQFKTAAIDYDGPRTRRVPTPHPGPGLLGKYPQQEMAYNRAQKTIHASQEPNPAAYSPVQSDAATSYQKGHQSSIPNVGFKRLPTHDPAISIVLRDAQAARTGSLETTLRELEIGLKISDAGRKQPTKTSGNSSRPTSSKDFKGKGKARE